MTLTPEIIDGMEEWRELDALVAERLMGWTRREGGHSKPLHTEIRSLIGTRPNVREVVEPYDDWESKGPHRYLLNPQGLQFFFCNCKSDIDLPWFSRDIEAAWEICDHLHFIDIRHHRAGGFYEASFLVGKHPGEYLVTAIGKTAPLAICRAGLKTTL